MDSPIYARAVPSTNDDMPFPFGDNTYTAEVITLYKGDNEIYVDEEGKITFVTAGTSSLCGISLDVGDGAEGEEQEYLLGLTAGSSEDIMLRAHLCGIYWEWSDDIDVSLLESCASTPSPTQPTPSPAQPTPSEPPSSQVS